ncbi:ABC transporter permease subunit [Rhodococcus sp. BP-252]|uniref:ABC transporter permease subunit n=1 Tax=unclassified Rhodococcus (in: high G+C Gram-positive bacteria) TaxID=192944 RepID=UPI001C9A37FD|nr:MULTISPECIES: ABC transporter permease subunit [unclassified Rhodococcus (in: high G+C Gram-positive bacteria)]MBY6411552.1 ABC transporter permease subunit [Rhodococcus sp. BP-320]MBY6417934.1 ABC transporter permease subunit [Rhodococcus sp. BP-321]MBY6422165.1 ABC transporter permease subunit [Rhodococcus sp. BP-324]MBY6427732.1 ABC transporter permease subunit [Rhodococcus sp. BP-323]MBY6433049.1 ABC transporter permease subunit [Rhodococcus sp. BP-322]
MKRAFALLAAIAALLAVAGCGSSSGPLLEQIEDKGVIVVGTEGTYSPFSFQGSDGQLTGYDIDVVNAVAQELGVRVEFVQTPFDSIFAGLESQRFDLIANQVTINPERQGAYDLSKPYTVSEGEILTTAANTSITSTADLAGKTTAQSSTSNWAGVASDAGANVEAVEGFVQAVTLVKDGRVDATVNDSLAIAEYLKTTGDTGVKVAAQTGDTSYQAFVARKDTGLMDEIDSAIDTLQADGTLAQISEKYFGSDVAAPTADTQAPTSDAAASDGRSKLDLILDNLWPMLKATVTMTIPLTAISFVIGLVIALAVALARISSNKALSSVARFYVSIIRGTPLLLQLFIVFYALPELGVVIDPFPAAVVAFSLNVGGYAAEVIRAAILSVPKGQWEAAETIGMGYRTSLQRIILPQALRTAVPPLSNTLISLLKDTSLASTILVTELLRVAQLAAAPTFDFFALYSVAAIYYWVICMILSFFQGKLEVRLDRYVTK